MQIKIFTCIIWISLWIHWNYDLCTDSHLLDLFNRNQSYVSNRMIDAQPLLTIIRDNSIRIELYCEQIMLRAYKDRSSQSIWLMDPWRIVDNNIRIHSDIYSIVSSTWPIGTRTPSVVFEYEDKTRHAKAASHDKCDLQPITNIYNIVIGVVNTWNNN